MSHQMMTISVRVKVTGGGRAGKGRSKQQTNSSTKIEANLWAPQQSKKGLKTDNRPLSKRIQDHLDQTE